MSEQLSLISCGAGRALLGYCFLKLFQHEKLKRIACLLVSCPVIVLGRGGHTALKKDYLAWLSESSLYEWRIHSLRIIDSIIGVLEDYDRFPPGYIHSFSVKELEPHQHTRLSRYHKDGRIFHSNATTHIPSTRRVPTFRIVNAVDIQNHLELHTKNV